MEEDLKRNDIKPEPTANDEKIKLLCSKKDEYQKEYNEALEELKKDINKYKKEKNDKFNQKMDFLETRIKHDLFNIIYRGFEFPPEKNEISLKDSDSSDSNSDKEDSNNK